MTTNDMDVEVLVCLFSKDKFQTFMISFPKNRFSLVPSVGLVEAGGGRGYSEVFSKLFRTFQCATDSPSTAVCGWKMCKPAT